MLKENKTMTIIVAVLFLLLTVSCKKQCTGIIGNIYKGYGFFYYYQQDHQDGYYEIHFIPVCNDKEDVIKMNDNSLKPMPGLSFHCTKRNRRFRDIFIYSKAFNLYDENGTVNAYQFVRILPVYIELGITDENSNRNKLYSDFFRLSSNSVFQVQFASYFSDSIKINKIELLGIERSKKLEVSESEINKIMNQYNCKDLSDFNNTLISLDNKDSIFCNYLIKDGASVFYFVKYDTLLNKIINIECSFEKKEQKILTESALIKIINNFRKYNVYLIGKDNEGNIYLNPYEIDAPPFYMKIKDETDKKIIEKLSFTFEKYKDDWYLNKDYNDFLGR
ncbi:MAG: hypothetical protein FWF54_10335 [Candidatus Azobacteroides sp.]|nr:hypothetical protein [Candidatus Azobacteroides sp.]